MSTQGTGHSATRPRTRQARTALVSGVLLGTMCVFAGCSSASTRTAATGAVGSDKTGAAFLGQAEAAVAAGIAGTGSAPPTSGPRAQSGKTVWIIPCKAAAPSCEIPAEAVATAGRHLGWTTKIVDGQFDPVTWNNIIQEATSAKVDALVLSGIDCAPVQAKLGAARAAGIKIVGVQAVDCNEEFGGGGAAEFDAELPEHGAAYDQAAGKLQADWLIAKTDGKAKVLATELPGVPDLANTHQGFIREMAKCTTCQVHDLSMSAAQVISNDGRGMVTTALTRTPDINAIETESDTLFLALAEPVIEQAKSRDQTLLGLGLEGLAPNVQLIKSGIQGMGAGVPINQIGWAAADSLNRLFAGQPLVNEGIGLQIIDQQHNLPASGAYDGLSQYSNYEQTYEKTWAGA